MRVGKFVLQRGGVRIRGNPDAQLQAHVLQDLAPVLNVLGEVGETLRLWQHHLGGVVLVEDRARHVAVGDPGAVRDPSLLPHPAQDAQDLHELAVRWGRD